MEAFHEFACDSLGLILLLALMLGVGLGYLFKQGEHDPGNNGPPYFV